MNSWRKTVAQITTGLLLVIILIVEGGCTYRKPNRDRLTQDAVLTSFQQLDRIVSKAMSETGIPGIAVGIVYENKVLYTKGYGRRSTESNQAVNAETVFQIASLSKPIASTIVAGIVGKGTIKWNDPVVRYDSDFLLSDAWVSNHVTFEDLFSHRTGLPGNAGNDLESIGYNRSEILRRLRFAPLSPFRTTYSYSNFGLTEGAQIAAQAADAKWADLSETILFGPAGMVSTSMRHADFASRKNRAELHVKIDGKWKPAFKRMPDAQAPAGGVSSNVIDLSRWIQLVLSQGRVGEKQIIDATSLNRTLTPMILKRQPFPTISGQAGFYGLGWNIETDLHGKVRWSHSGAFSVGAATSALILPAENIGIVVLTNGAPIGVPEAIANAYIDWIETGSISKDWLTIWRERLSGLYGTAQDWSDPANIHPARNHESYVGTYTNEYVGDIKIRNIDGKLSIIMGPSNRVFPLQHWSGDTFTYIHDPELPDYRSSVSFKTAVNGKLHRVSISTFSDAGAETLTRHPIQNDH